MELFALATRMKLRFNSVRGALTVEQLWSVPLTSKDGFDLDAIAKGINAELKSLTEDSFVQIKSNPQKTTVEKTLEVVKFVIATKLAEREENEKRVANAEKRRKLLDALAAQEDKELASMSRDDILKQLADIAD